MSYYIYYDHRHDRYTVIDEDGYTRIMRTEGNVTVFSTSFLRAESIWIETTNDNYDGIIDEEVYKKEIINKNHENYEYFIVKLNVIEKITKVTTNIDNFQYLLGDANDKKTVVAAYDWKGILVTCDYHEAANAIYLNLSYIFKIPADIKDIKNYKKYHIGEIKKRVEIINKNIK